MDQLFATQIIDPLMRSIAAFAALFICTLLVGAVLGLGALIDATGLTQRIVCLAWCLVCARRIGQ